MLNLLNFKLIGIVKMSDLCPCGILKAKCTHPNCSDAECPACNQTPCKCNDESCESCGA